MLTINLSSISSFICFLLIWLIDSFLNYRLAKRMGEKEKTSYFIPMLSYYRFGVLTRTNSIVVVMGLGAAVVASVWWSSILPLQYIIIASLLAIIVNTVIIIRAAKLLAKSKWQYLCSNIVFGLVGIILQPIILIFLSYNYSSLLVFIFPLLHSVILQVPKIMLLMTTRNRSKEKVFLAFAEEK